jgi:hypothetical protein
VEIYFLSTNHYVLEFDFEPMWFKAQFIVDTNGIFNENAAGLFLFSIGKNFYIHYIYSFLIVLAITTVNGLGVEFYPSI